MFEADDYQQLAGELGAQPEAGQDNTPAEGEPKQPEGDTATPEVPESTPAPEVTPEQTPDADDKASKAFAALRATNAKYEAAFKLLQSDMGTSSVDETLERLSQASLEKQAKAQNTSPEVLARLNQLEEQNLSLVEQKKQEALINSFGLVQNEFNLTNNQVMEFARQLDSVGYDLFNSNLDLVSIYKGLNHETLLSKAVEAAKQEVIKQGEAASKAPGIDHTTGNATKDGKTEITTMGELETLFKSLPVQ